MCGIGFSLAPALQATRADLVPALKEGRRCSCLDTGVLALRNLAVVAQVTGSLMLLLITGFLVIGLTKVTASKPNSIRRRWSSLSIDPVRDGYTPEKAQALFEKLPERLRSSGAVRSFALAAQPPFSSFDPDDGVQMTAQDSRMQKSVVKETVGAGYFAALNEPMLAGREFEEADERIQDQRGYFQRNPTDESKAGAARDVALPVVLNESAASGFFGSGNAIGKRVRDDKQSYEVVGVVRDLKNGIGMQPGHRLFTADTT